MGYRVVCAVCAVSKTPDTSFEGRTLQPDTREVKYKVTVFPFGTLLAFAFGIAFAGKSSWVAMRGLTSASFDDICLDTLSNVV